MPPPNPLPPRKAKGTRVVYVDKHGRETLTRVRTDWGDGYLDLSNRSGVRHESMKLRGGAYWRETRDAE